MPILLLFAFISGLLTILAPCIWPLLPIVLSSSATGGKQRALGVTLGIVSSFALLTLTLSYIVSIVPFNPDNLRLLAVIVISFLGISLLVPRVGQMVEGWISRFTSRLPGRNQTGLWGGIVTGVSLGVVWSPCAGPILATIATLSASQAVSFGLVLVTLAYIAGLGIPLFLFLLAGNWLFARSRFLSPYTGRIQQVFGVIMILTALAIFTNYDKVLQIKLLEYIPSYSRLLYALEGSEQVKSELQRLKGTTDTSSSGFSNLVQPGSSGLPKLGVAPEFVGIEKWLNSDPVTMKSLRGKVVLVDFWTYTCINCIRTLPHITEWYEKYKDKGFVVIGVHTPEFEFEKKTENVQNAIEMYKIHYPVAQDNTYVTWNAYSNQYWPAKYLFDTEGNLRKFHFGEGEYEEMEAAIVALLKEQGAAVDVSTQTTKDETPSGNQTPETYLGLTRFRGFQSPETAREGVQVYSLPDNLTPNGFAYQGSWNMQQESSTAGAGSALRIRFFASKVFLVMTPPQGAKVRVLLDGKVVSVSQAGKDVKDGYIQFDEARLYELINLQNKRGEHLLQLEFQTDGVTVYAFTFG